MDNRNCPRDGAGGFTPGRKCLKRTVKEREDDLESGSSESCSNRYGFIAYSVNSGEKSGIKIKTFSQPPAYSCESGSDPDHSASSSSGPSPSARKHWCVDQRQSDKEDRLEPHSKKRRAKEGNSNDIVHPLWLG